MPVENLPFETIKLDSGEVQTLEETYAALTSKFDISLPDDVNISINIFDVFTYNHDANIGGILQINHPANNCYLLFIRIHYYYNSYRYGGEPVDYYKYQLWGMVKLKKDFGRVLIRRETFRDKILGLIHPVELEFKDDKAFNNKFYVVTNDEDKALDAMNWNFRNAIMNINDADIMMETVNDILIVGNNKWLNAEEAVQLAEITLKLASIK